jgi:hypothetical protein
MNEREPDQSEDPRRQGTGEGYPEENPQGQTPVEGTEQGPEAGTENEASADTHADQDEAPGGATGNPGAAGS